MELSLFHDEWKKKPCQGILFFTASCSSLSPSPIYLLTIVNQEYIQSSSIAGVILEKGYDGDPGNSLSNKYLKYNLYH